MRVNTRTVIVEWGHCDPGAIVYFPRYFEWFDAGTAALFEDVGIPKAAMLRATAAPAFRWSTCDRDSSNRRPSATG